MIQSYMDYLGMTCARAIHVRFLKFVLPAILIAGCATVVPEEDSSSSTNDLQKEDSSIAYGPCRWGRDALYGSVSQNRAAIMRRGFTWYDQNVPFSEIRTFETYRTDCSGFVSMCYGLKKPGWTTHDFGHKGTGTFKLGSFDDLVPADALVRTGEHSFIFLGWNDSDKKGLCVLEQSSTKNDMQFRVRLRADLERDGFFPIRSDECRDDTDYTPCWKTQPSTPTTPPSTCTGGGTCTTPPPYPTCDGGGSCSTPPGSGQGDGGTYTPPPPPTYTPPPPPPPPPPPVCVSDSLPKVCSQAQATGCNCGRVIDNCGRAVDCYGYNGFGCSADQICYDNKYCGAPACVPKPAADVCYTMQLQLGINCGKVPDGCGGVVDCDEVQGFGCQEGQTCGAQYANKCGTKGGTAPNVASYKGDHGDQSDNESLSSTRTTSKDPASRIHASDDDASASAGCSTSGTGTGTGSSLAGAAFGLAFLLGARRRRSRN